MTSVNMEGKKNESEKYRTNTDIKTTNRERQKERWKPQQYAKYKHSFGHEEVQKRQTIWARLQESRRQPVLFVSESDGFPYG